MSGFWNAIVHHLTSNYEAYIMGLTLWAVALGKSMPEKFPTSVQEWWSWFRASVQTVLPAPSNTTPPPQIAPQPPVVPILPVAIPAPTK